MEVALVSPERILFSGEAEMVVCRTIDGEIAFLTGHAPLLGALGIAAVRVRQPDGSEVRAAVHGGFVEVRDNRVSILSDVAELPEQIDAGRARRAREEAERRVREDPNDPASLAALHRADIRLQVAGQAG